MGKKLTYKGCFTSDVEKNRSEIIFFLGVIVNFLRHVVAFFPDVERRKVKRYLFSQGADLTFRGNYSGGFLLARGAVRRAPKGQPARSPGQSEATPWVLSSLPSFRPARAKA